MTDFLMTGEENAVTGRELCDRFGFDRRDLTIAVERERRNGVPICASCGSNPGYYLASDKREMINYCKSLERRLKEVQKTLNACQKTVALLPVGECKND